MWHGVAVLINGSALRTIRERSGLSQTALAAAAGTDRSHLSNIESGRRNCSDELCVALAKALKVDLPSILSDPAEAATR